MGIRNGMKKSLLYLESIFFVMGLNLAIFYLRPFTFTVIDRFSMANTEHMLFAVSNTILYCFFVFLIAYNIKEKRCIYSGKVFLKLFAVKILPWCFLIRILSDLFLLVLDLWLSAVAQIMCIPVEALVLFLAFYIAQKALTQGVPANKKNKKVLEWGYVLWVFLCTSICVNKVCSYHSMVEDVVQKYKDTSFLYDAGTIYFALQLVNLLFSIGAYIILFTHYGLIGGYSRDKIRKYRSSNFFIKLGAFVAVACVVCLLKVLVFPYGTISTIHNKRNYAISISESTKKRIYENYTIFEVERNSGIDNSDVVYKKTRVTLAMGNDSVLSFDMPYNREDGELIPISAEGVDVAYRYDFEAIIFIEDGSAFAIRWNDINSYNKQNGHLIAICEHLIQEGYFEAFVYAHKYLSKYDPNFINAFTAEQQAMNWAIFQKDCNSYLNPAYIEKFLLDSY